MSFKSRVLNLYNAQNEGDHFRIEPSDSKVTLNYNAGGKPVDFLYLTVQDVDVHAKMFENAQAVVDEKARALASEAVIASDLETENQRATSRENSIESELKTEKQRLVGQEVFEAQELANEVAARIALSVSLSNAITNEANARTASDNTHTTDIANEIARAVAEEKRIDDRITAYGGGNDLRLDSAESAHSDYVVSNDARSLAIEQKAVSDYDLLSASVESESETRSDAIDALNARFDALLNGSPEHLDQLTEIVSRFETDGATYVSRLNNLESVVQELVNQLQN